jgi:hypothetical protein
MIKFSRQKLTFLVQHSNQDDSLLVFFTEDESVGIKPIRKYIRVDAGSVNE